METRIIEYPRANGLDYHHNSPLIGEIPANDYAHFHRSIDQLRTLNERGILNTNHIQSVLVTSSTSPLIVQATPCVTYNEVKFSDDIKILNGYHTVAPSANNNNKIARRNVNGQAITESEYEQKKEHGSLDNNFRIIHSPQHQHYSINTSCTSPHMHINLHQNNNYNAAVDNHNENSNNHAKAKIFTSKADLQLHTQAHMREAKPYKCTQCSKSFANSSYLSQHTRIHLGIKPYRCEICQRKFTQLSHLQQHIRTHTGDKPYKCRHVGCVKAFSQLSNLQSHSRSHQTDKPYKCNSCYKCFVDEPSLLDHIPKHKESKHLKTHICQYCGKSYTQETYLQKHMQKHAERTDKRPPITLTRGGQGGGGGGGGGGGNNQQNSGGNNNNNNNNNNNSSSNNNANNNLNNGAVLNTSIVTGMSNEQGYWPKVSPDSAANINTDVLHHQEYQQQQQQLQNGHEMHHQRDDNGDQNVHLNGHSLSLPPSSLASANVYDSQSKLTSNSAFTPINAMPSHFNIQHHQLSQRPYIYDAISIQNKNVAQNSGNSFPNQLISLHQIRNYAHQPSGLMSGELIGVNVAGKDKG